MVDLRGPKLEERRLANRPARSERRNCSKKEHAPKGTPGAIRYHIHTGAARQGRKAAADPVRCEGVSTELK